MKKSVQKFPIFIMIIFLLLSLVSCSKNSSSLMDDSGKYQNIYEEACNLIYSGDYDSALELLEELDGYADSARIISAVNAMPYISEIETDIVSNHSHLSLVGMDIYCEYDPIKYTFTEVWEMTSSGLYGKLSQLLSAVSSQEVGYDAEGMRSLAEDMYFDYFYSRGIIDVICTVEVRDNANDITQSGTFGLEDIPTQNADGLASYDEVTKYASMRGLVIEDNEILSYTGNAAIIEIPDGVIAIAPYAFYGNENITEVQMPDSITSVGYHAFDGCKNLTTVSFSNSLEYIDECAFTGCINLTGVVLPATLNYIGDNAFSECEGLTDIILPDSLEFIGEYAFSLSGLNSIILPASLSEVSNGLFYDCASLVQVTIPEAITEIGKEAFYKCTALTRIDLPASLTAIGYMAFDWNLSDIYFGGTLQEWEKILNSEFSGISEYDFENGYEAIVHCSNGIWKINNGIMEGAFYDVSNNVELYIDTSKNIDNGEITYYLTYTDYDEDLSFSDIPCVQKNSAGVSTLEVNLNTDNYEGTIEIKYFSTGEISYCSDIYLHAEDGSRLSCGTDDVEYPLEHRDSVG